MNNGFLENWRRSITLKIFFVTLTLLLISAALIYSTLYFFLPHFYQKYKINQLNNGVELLVKDIQSLSIEEAKEYIDQFARLTNALLILNDNRGNTVYISAIHSIAGMKTSLETKLTAELEYSSGPHVESGSVMEHNPPTIGTEPVSNFSKPYSLSIPISLKGQVLTLNVYATLQPVNEAAMVLVLFIPYIGAFILLISAIGAYLYSGIISRPLIRLNHAAKKMAGLEFDPIIGFNTSDEIGQLSTSLNEMSVNLQGALNELHCANKQLKNQIIMERELEDKRRHLFSMISHELKSPLTAVKGQLEGMIHGFGVYKDRDKYLKRSYEILGEMEKLIYEILQIAKLEQHCFLPEIEKINLSDLILNAVKKVEFFASEKNICIVTEVSKENFIETDKKLIEKAIYNIIHNGVMYSNANEKVIIKLADNVDADNLSFTVLNTGAQIPESLLGKIFDPFYRLDKYGGNNKGGSGLGLYLVKKIFEALSVEYSIKNVQEGVVFQVIFK